MPPTAEDIAKSYIKEYGANMANDMLQMTIGVDPNTRGLTRSAITKEYKKLQNAAKKKEKMQKKQQKKEAASNKKLKKHLNNATNMTMSKKAKAALGTLRKTLSKRKSNLQPHWPGFAESD